MAELPDLNLLAESGLNGLEQYLAWALTELRRLAIAEGSQQTVRLTMAIDSVKNLDEDRFEGLLRCEVNLNYDSAISLSNGLSFIEAVQPVSAGQAEVPNYVCSTSIDTEIYYKIKQIANRDTAIDSLEKFVYWLCLSWHKSKFSLVRRIENSTFSFFDENPNGGLVKFSFAIPLDYQVALSENLVCAAYQSPFRDALNYQFAPFGSTDDDSNDNSKSTDVGNDNNYGNTTVLGN